MRRRLFAVLFVLAVTVLVAVATIAARPGCKSPCGEAGSMAQGTKDGTTLQCGGIPSDCSSIPR